MSIEEATEIQNEPERRMTFPGILKDINLDNIHVPIEKYQREAGEAAINKLASNWNFLAYDPIKVYWDETYRRYEVFEGGHRTLAAKGIGLVTLPAFVFSIEDKMAAKVFGEQNRGRKTITRYDEFYAALFEEDALALSIERVLQTHGFRLVARRPKGSLNEIKGVGSIYSIVNRLGLKALADTLVATKELWPDDTNRADSGFLQGLSEFLHYYGDKLDEEARGRLEGKQIRLILNKASGMQQRTRRTRVASTLREMSGLRKRTKAPF